MTADSDALRSRRKRAHASGDHSLCRRNCGVTVTPARIAELSPARGDNPVNPRASLRSLALRLEAAHEADPANAMVARELRVTLLALAGDAPAGEDDVDRIRREWEQVRDGV
jgi:hypothetical protein